MRIRRSNYKDQTQHSLRVHIRPHHSKPTFRTDRSYHARYGTRFRHCIWPGLDYAALQVASSHEDLGQSCMRVLTLHAGYMLSLKAVHQQHVTNETPPHCYQHLATEQTPPNAHASIVN